MWIRIMCLFSVLALAAVSASATEVEELREKAEAMQREAAELAEQGKKSEATSLRRQATALLEEAELLERGGKDEGRPEITKLKALLELLQQKEKQLEDTAGADEALEIVRREAAAVEDKLRHLLRESREHEAHGPHEDISRRVEHMRIAVEHLHQAGLHEVARHVAEQAEAAERELHELHRHHEGDGIHAVLQQLEELRHEVGRLRDEVQQLREKRG